MFLNKKNLILIALLFFMLGSFLFTNNTATAYGECDSYGYMSIYDSLTNSCKCMRGYVFSENMLGDTTCVSCSTKYGYGATSNINGGCKCRNGFYMKKTYNKYKCEPMNNYCTDKYGYMSMYDNTTDSCTCMIGYVFGKNVLGDAACVSCSTKYGYGATSDGGGGCKCRAGYEITKKSYGSELECKSCFNKYGLNSSYNYLTNGCECDDDYTLKDGSCVKKQHNVYFYLKELNTDNKEAIIKSSYDNKYYYIKYKYGCYSSSFKKYLKNNIVVNLGTDYDLDRQDYIVLYDNSETCDIGYVNKVDSNFTLEEENETGFSNLKFINPNKQKNTVEKEEEEEEEEEEEKKKEIKEQIIVKSKIQYKKLECKENEALSLNKKYCIKIPQNAHVVQSLTDVWMCDDKYEEIDNSCKKIKEKTDTTKQQKENRQTLIVENPKEGALKTFFKNTFKKIFFWKK
jgi:hypothetical protein